MSPAYKKERPDVKVLLGLGFAIRELGESEGLSDLIEIAIKTAPLFLKRFGYYGDTETALQWFKSPQLALKGDIPWMIMHTEYGRRRVRRALDAEIKTADALAALVAAGQIILPTKKGKIKPFKGIEVFSDIRQSPFTIKEAAEYLEAAEITVRRWVKNGSLKASNIGGSIVFNVDDLKAFKNKRLS